MVIALGLALMLSAGAVEPVPSAADEADLEISEEVIVYGEFLVLEARRRVDATLREAGFRDVTEKDGRTIYRHQQPWRGEVHVHDDGLVRIKRQPVRFEGREMPWAERNSALAWAGCVVWLPLCVRVGGQTVSRRRNMGYQTGTVRWVNDDVGEWTARIADLAVDRKVDALPVRLERLWETGEPLAPGARLVTHAERREALYEYWASRTDTVWGEEVRRAVESFMRGVVQHTEQPFTRAEVETLEARFPTSRPIRLHLSEVE